MAGQSLAGLDWGNLQIRTRPRKFGVYIAARSFPKGIIPTHLKSYTEKFSSLAATCAAETTELSGNERVIAMNACVGQGMAK